MDPGQNSWSWQCTSSRVTLHSVIVCARCKTLLCAMAADISPSSGPSGLFPFSCYHQHRTSFSCTLSPPLCTLGAWWGEELISHLPAALTFRPSCTAWWQETDTGCGLLHHLFVIAHGIQSKSGSAEGLAMRLGIACNYVHIGIRQAWLYNQEKAGTKSHNNLRSDKKL